MHRPPPRDSRAARAGRAGWQEVRTTPALRPVGDLPIQPVQGGARRSVTRNHRAPAYCNTPIMSSLIYLVEQCTISNMERRRWEQLGLQAARGTWGGIRRNAGRRRGRTTVERVSRPVLSGREPVHVTLKLRPDAPPLRRHRTHRLLRAAFRAANERFGFRLIHYSAQSNHLHLICEAADRRSLSRGVQGLAVRIARRLNRAAQRRGSLFSDRYHLHVLTTPREVRHALRYVLRNAVRHRAAPEGPFLDVYSSACSFDGWREPLRLPLVNDDELPTVPARVWLLTTGWRRGGPLSLADFPRS
jgi:putative transposase